MIMHVGLHFWNATIHQSSQDKMRGYKNLIIMHQCTTHQNKRKGAPIVHTQVNKLKYQYTNFQSHRSWMISRSRSCVNMFNGIRSCQRHFADQSELFKDHGRARTIHTHTVRHMAIIIRFLALISCHVVWIIIMCKMTMHYIPTTIVHETNNYCHILCMCNLVAHRSVLTYIRKYI